MWKIVSEGEFDFYEIEWQLRDVPFSYLFEVKSGDQICYFSRCGVSDQREDFYAFMIVPGFSTPEWAKGAVMYQIFVDRFCNGDPTNDVEDGEYIYIGAPSVKIKDWSKVPAAMDIRNFYGGDLQGVMDKLDYLQDLGVEVVYFNPLFVSPSNHKYDIQDYDYIDPHYGKIVSDGGETLPKGAKDNTYNKSYDGWWGHDTLPKLSYEDSPELEQYIMDIGKKWVSPPYNADGWRLDVAADLGCSNEYNHMFWKRFRKEVKEANPEALILAEHYGDPGEWLQGDEWDSVMNYDAFMEPLTWFLTGMEKHSDERRTDLWGNADNFIGGMRHFMASMLTPSLQVAMNELSNHDHSRFLTRTNHIVGRAEHVGAKAAEEGVNYAVMREAVTVQMTWVGAPTVYYGDEAGVCGFTDPDNRRTYPWGRENKELLAFHKEMIRIHKQEKPLRKGSIKLLYAERNVLAYARFQEDEQIIVILNNSKDLKELTVPVWFAGVPKQGRMERFMYTYEEGYTTEYDEFIVENGEIVINMGRHSAIVMKPISEGEKTWQGK